MNLHAEWEEKYSRENYPFLWKPKGCPLRKPNGPLKGCEDTCRVFKSCVEFTKNERADEERYAKRLERLYNE